jgi:protein-S-isoprenylcysteine O-methyltransferase Ste14
MSIEPRGDAKPRSGLAGIYAGAAVGAAIGALLALRAAPTAKLGSAFAPMLFALGVWTALSIYWQWAARKSLTTKSSESLGSRLLHLVLFDGALVLSFWPFEGWPAETWSHVQFPRILPASTALVVAGALVAASALVLALAARRALGANWSARVTLKQGHELVQTGPYRLIRHPIYTAVIGIHFGTGLISGRLQGPIAVAMITLAYLRKLKIEESLLRTEFGASYDDYRRRSWALVPWVY